MKLTWDSALTGLGSLDRLIIDDPVSVKPTESDASLRERILYVAGDSAAFSQEVMRAQGKDLDDIAERYQLRRRTAKECQ